MTVRCFRFTWLVLVLGLLSPLLHAESNPAVVLRDLHTAQMSLHASEMAFHRYQGSEGDSKLLVNLNDTLKQLKTDFQTAFQALNEMGMKEQLGQISGHWKEAAKSLNSAMTAIAGKGFAEGQVINNYLLNSLYTANDLQTAYQEVLKTTGLKIPAALQSLREESLLFSEMSALYMEQSTSQFGYAYRSEAGNTDTLDVMAQRFAGNLDTIQRQLGNNADAIKKLNHIRNKWQFLEKSFIHYNENSVPYLVVKFGGEITENLEALAADFDKG